jgi:hypothetical protein
MKPEQLEIARLKREVTKLKAERDILKKAAAYFALTAVRAALVEAGQFPGSRGSPQDTFGRLPPPPISPNPPFAVRCADKSRRRPYFALGAHAGKSHLYHPVR